MAKFPSAPKYHNPFHCASITQHLNDMGTPSKPSLFLTEQHCEDRSWCQWVSTMAKELFLLPSCPPSFYLVGRHDHQHLEKQLVQSHMMESFLFQGSPHLTSLSPDHNVFQSCRLAERELFSIHSSRNTLKSRGQADPDFRLCPGLFLFLCVKLHWHKHRWALLVYNPSLTTLTQQQLN